MVVDGRLSAGHARALLSLEDEEMIRVLAREIIKKGLSVRQVEAIVKKSKQLVKPPKAPPTAWDNSYFAEVQLALSQSLSRKVKIEGEKNKGRLIIEFYDEADLKEIVASISKE